MASPPQAPAELPQRLQHRVVGLLTAVALDALAARDAPPHGGRRLALELVDQGGLADARLPGDEDELPVVPQHPPQAVVQPVERAPPSDQPALRRGGTLRGGVLPRGRRAAGAGPVTWMDARATGASSVPCQRRPSRIDHPSARRLL
jgi:hypothetical protein